MTPEAHHEIAMFLAAVGLAAAAFAWFTFVRQRALRTSRRATCGGTTAGYVRIEGVVQPVGELVRAGSGIPCVWFCSSWSKPRTGVRITIGARSDDDGRIDVDEKGASPFFIQDASGRVLIDLTELEVQTPNTLGPQIVWGPTLDPSPRLTAERVLTAGRPIVAVGALTVDGPSVEKKVAELLRAWKHDEAELKKRFDANRDGKIDAEEWDRARAAARAEAAAAISGQGPVRVLGRPKDGRPFVVSDAGWADLAGSAGTQAVVWAALSAAACIAAVWQWRA